MKSVLFCFPLWKDTVGEFTIVHPRPTLKRRAYFTKVAEAI